MQMSRISWLLAILVLLGLGAWRLIHIRTGTSAAQRANASDIAAPVRNSAFSTLTKDRQINTRYNPRGSTVTDLTLSDGTHVWLNAGSSIRYPVTFPTYDRTVEINGEAYFDIAADAGRPFGIKNGNIFVRALGTSLNIKASGDPLCRISLLQGSARVTAGNTLTLGAGQQAVVDNKVELVKDANIDAVTDWKTGLFSFSHTDLVSALRELSRWYDVNIIYDKAPPNRYFTGKLDRTLSLDQVLQTLGEGRLHYTIDPLKRQLTILQ